MSQEIRTRGHKDVDPVLSEAATDLFDLCERVGKKFPQAQEMVAKLMGGCTELLATQLVIKLIESEHAVEYAVTPERQGGLSLSEVINGFTEQIEQLQDRVPEIEAEIEASRAKIKELKDEIKKLKKARAAMLRVTSEPERRQLAEGPITRCPVGDCETEKALGQPLRMHLVRGHGYIGDALVKAMKEATVLQELASA